MPFTYFCVVGPNDASVFECGRFGDGLAPTVSGGAVPSSVAPPGGQQGSSGVTSGSGQQQVNDSQQLARQFMLYSALDLADEAMWSRGDFYLSKIDKFDDRFFVSAYVGFAPIKLLLMQDQEPHDNVRPFFADAYEMCVRYLMSPFVSASQPIRSREFEERMVSIYTRYF